MFNGNFISLLDCQASISPFSYWRPKRFHFWVFGYYWLPCRTRWWRGKNFFFQVHYKYWNIADILCYFKIFKHVPVPTNQAKKSTALCSAKCSAKNLKTRQIANQTFILLFFEKFAVFPTCFYEIIIMLAKIRKQVQFREAALTFASETKNQHFL